ncbi:MAG: endocytosis defective- protein [Ramalina farinacea]|uniref:Endocytosis defective- protein n=1 Tax=Ramalina farinacea TaxID=258253 RepID=A0AA43QF00_9LECA|nr:endocytosis defective- protein [Ramalina farinacea]
MPPQDVAKYSAIYSTHKHRHGSLNFSSLTDLYDTLNVPDTDLRSAWNLVNPASEPAVGKNAALAFLHILNRRHEGYRIPRSVPPSLRATFEGGEIDYNVESRGVKSGAPPQQRRYEEDTSTGRKAKFGDAYLSRLGVGGGAGQGPTRGTDFSGVKTEGDWEEVRLKRQLSELEEKIEKVEAGAKARRGGGGGWKEIRELEQGEGRVKQGESLRGIEKEIEGVKEMVEGLERHMRSREEVLDGLRREIEAEKRKGR